MAIRIIIDSSSDLPLEEANACGFTVIPMKTYFGETEYIDGITMSHEEFFTKLIETDVLPTTSQITPYEYGNVFREVTKDGDDAICITLSSKLSGCYQSACIAADEFDGHVIVVDSLNATIGEMILIRRAYQLLPQFKDAQELADILNEEKKKIRVLALLDTLEYLKKGGRISAATAIAGTVLSIKPVIAVMNGEVVAVGKARGSKAGNNLLTELIRHEGAVSTTRPFTLAYSGLSDALLQKYMTDCAYLYENVAKREDLPVVSLGSTIGTHVGPGAIGIAFFAE